MFDPHVNTLSYRLVNGKNTSYAESAFIEHETEILKMSLKNNVLTCNLKVHYSSISTARTEVEKLLKAWEIDAAIQRGPGEMTFDFLNADVIDRTPFVQNQVHFMSASASGVGTMSATPHVIRGKYPEVPKDFVVNPNVEILWKRYEIYLDGRDQLLSMAYFCLSYLENLAGERGNIEEKYKINRIVINRLGNLSSARGDYVTARKGKDHKFKPISSNEKEWIEACIKKLIRRLGEHEKDPLSISMLTMSDLPLLSGAD